MSLYSIVKSQGTSLKTFIVNYEIQCTWFTTFLFWRPGSLSIIKSKYFETCLNHKILYIFFFSGSNCESLQQSWLIHYKGQCHQFFIIYSQVVVPTETYQPVKWHWFLFHGCGKCHNIKWLACLSLILSWSVTNNYWIIIRLSMWYHADTRFDHS